MPAVSKKKESSVKVTSSTKPKKSASTKKSVEKKVDKKTDAKKSTGKKLTEKIKKGAVGGGVVGIGKRMTSSPKKEMSSLKRGTLTAKGSKKSK